MFQHLKPTRNFRNCSCLLCNLFIWHKKNRQQCPTHLNSACKLNRHQNMSSPKRTTIVAGNFWTAHIHSGFTSCLTWDCTRPCLFRYCVVFTVATGGRGISNYRILIHVMAIHHFSWRLIARAPIRQGGCWGVVDHIEILKPPTSLRASERVGSDLWKWHRIDSSQMICFSYIDTVYND